MIGTVAAVVVFLPRMTVVPDDFSVDPAHPYPMSFTITNTNFIPLRKMNVYLGLCYFQFGEGKVPSCIPPYKTRFGPDAWSSHTLAMDERFTIALEDVVSLRQSTHLNGADISIIVNYEPWLIPYRREREFKYVTKTQRDGRLHWFSVPQE